MSRGAVNVELRIAGFRILQIPLATPSGIRQLFLLILG
jgi:hypothetical protein